MTQEDKYHNFYRWNNFLVGKGKDKNDNTNTILKCTQAHLLYILGPFWRVTQGHKYAVRQNSAHDKHAE